MPQVFHEISLKHDANDVKPEFFVFRVEIDELLRSRPKVLLFTGVDCFFREAESQSTAGFYFNKNDNISIRSDQIDLLVGIAPIAVEDLITIDNQEFFCNSFSPCSRFIMFAHPKIYYERIDRCFSGAA